MALNPLQGGCFIHNDDHRVDGGSLLSRYSLKNKTAIVTGAAAGIGWAVAQSLAELGANVVIWYNTNKKGPERAKELEERYGIKCMLRTILESRKLRDWYTGRAYQVEVRDHAAVEKAIDEHVKEFNGRLDILVANAGIPWTKGPMVDGPIDHYRDVVAIDLDGTYFCARAAAKHWKRQKLEGTDLNGKKLVNYKAGSFVATASMSGVIVNVPQLQAAYNAAKAGVIHLCKSLAVEWALYARANSVSPGYIITEISNFVPSETKSLWKDRIPMGYDQNFVEVAVVTDEYLGAKASHTSCRAPSATWRATLPHTRQVRI
jgi:sorbose reductase